MASKKQRELLFKELLELKKDPKFKKALIKFLKTV